MALAGRTGAGGDPRHGDDGDAHGHAVEGGEGAAEQAEADDGVERLRADVVRTQRERGRVCVWGGIEGAEGREDGARKVAPAERAATSRGGALARAARRGAARRGAAGFCEPHFLGVDGGGFGGLEIGGSAFKALRVLPCCWRH